MSYKVLGKAEDVYKGYKPMKGLEGPFVYFGGRILYYDPREAQYWDPRTDFFVEQDEMNFLHQQMCEFLSR